MQELIDDQQITESNLKDYQIEYGEHEIRVNIPEANESINRSQYFESNSQNEIRLEYKYFSMRYPLFSVMILD
jgi:hypothetical protein